MRMLLCQLGNRFFQLRSLFGGLGLPDMCNSLFLASSPFHEWSCPSCPGGKLKFSIAPLAYVTVTVDPVASLVTITSPGWLGSSLYVRSWNTSPRTSPRNVIGTSS